MHEMAECLKAFASRVAGAASLEAAAEPSAALAAQCLTALDRFETAFGNARLNFIYQTPGPAPSAAQMSSLTAGYAALFAATHTIVSLHALLGLASSPAAAPLSPPPPPLPPLSALRRAVQAALRPPRSLTGARMAAALGGAAALGVLSGSSKGFWAPVTAAFVMGGATVRVAAMRLQGTVVGAVASYAALLGCAAAWPQGGGARKAALLAGLSLWVGACTFMREASRVNGYAGFVAAFSASILLFGPDCGGLGGGGPEAECDAGAWEELQTWAMDRILMTLAGIAVVIAVTTASSDAPADAQRALEQLVGGVKVRRAWLGSGLRLRWLGLATRLQSVPPRASMRRRPAQAAPHRFRPFLIGCALRDPPLHAGALPTGPRPMGARRPSRLHTVASRTPSPHGLQAPACLAHGCGLSGRPPAFRCRGTYRRRGGG